MMFNPLETLKEEHQAVKSALAILDRIVEDIEQGRDVKSEHPEQILDFLRTFVDRCHHGKEEDLLFPAMEEAGVPRNGGPVGVMLHEHELGRGHIKGLTQGLADYKGGDPSAGRRIAEHARGYRDLLLQHIEKEDNVLYPIAERVLPEKALDDLVEGFEGIERERIGQGQHEAFHEMLHRLGEIYFP